MRELDKTVDPTVGADPFVVYVKDTVPVDAEAVATPTGEELTTISCPADKLGTDTVAPGPVPVFVADAEASRVPGSMYQPAVALPEGFVAAL